MRHVLLATLLTVAAAGSPGSTCRAQFLYTGANLSAADMGYPPTPGNLGIYGMNYEYPSDAEVDYYVSKGMNTFRLPFRWERLQPTLNSPLDSAEFARLDGFVAHATSRGATVILDPHNFSRYYPDPNDMESSAQGLIGSASVPDSAFADLWSRLATDYKGNSHVAFGLMNEPNSMPTEQWVVAANSAISAIRAAGATNLVLVPGNGWTGADHWAENWYGTPNATAMLNIVDPGHNYAFEVHQYFDSDGSASSADIANNDPMIGVERLTAFTQWLAANHLKGFLGEFAVANSTIGPGSSQIGDEVLSNMLNYMKANSSDWLGFSDWAGGPWWGNYMFTLEPTNLGQPNQADQPAMEVLAPYLSGAHIAGDVNFDGIVNAQDIALLASHWLQTGSGNSADANVDGIVNGQDVERIASNWLRTASGSATVAPEPSTSALAALGAALLALGRRRSKPPQYPKRGGNRYL